MTMGKYDIVVGTGCYQKSAGVPRQRGLGLGQGEQVRAPFGRSEELGEPKQVGRSEDAGVPRQRGLGLGRDGGLPKCLPMSGDNLVFSSPTKSDC